jgi:putative ABC transport system permease protein
LHKAFARRLHVGTGLDPLLVVRNRPSLAAALTLGVVIGAAGAVFSGLHALLVEPFGYADARRVCLLRAWDEARNRETFNLPLAAFVALAPEAPSFERLAAYRYWSAGLAGKAPERVSAYRVTADTFPLLGVPPLLGRALEAQDARPGATKVAVLSHGLWQRRFAGAPDVLGREIRLDGEPHTIVGVMPRRFEFPLDNFRGELWTPLAVDAASALSDPGSAGSVVAIGRLRAGRSTQAAEAEARAAFRRHAAEDPATFRSLGVRVIPLSELSAVETRLPLGALLAALTPPVRPAPGSESRGGTRVAVTR